MQLIIYTLMNASSGINDMSPPLTIIDVLERCHLIKRDGLRNITSLDASISPNGSLSAGERQLVALARAILRHSQVIIMDEATSQIDSYLDDQVRHFLSFSLFKSICLFICIYLD